MCVLIDVFSHLCRRLVGELIVYPCSGACPSSTISCMTISATSGPITMKFYQKSHWAGEKVDWHQSTKCILFYFIIVLSYEKNHLIKFLSSLIVRFSARTTRSKVS